MHLKVKSSFLPKAADHALFYLLPSHVIVFPKHSGSSSRVPFFDYALFESFVYVLECCTLFKFVREH